MILALALRLDWPRRGKSPPKRLALLPFSPSRRCLNPKSDGAFGDFLLAIALYLSGIPPWVFEGTEVGQKLFLHSFKTNGGLGGRWFVSGLLNLLGWSETLGPSHFSIFRSGAFLSFSTLWCCFSCAYPDPASPTQCPKRDMRFISRNSMNTL